MVNPSLLGLRIRKSPHPAKGPENRAGRWSRPFALGRSMFERSAQPNARRGRCLVRRFRLDPGRLDDVGPGLDFLRQVGPEGLRVAQVQVNRVSRCDPSPPAS